MGIIETGQRLARGIPLRNDKNVYDPAANGHRRLSLASNAPEESNCDVATRCRPALRQGLVDAHRKLSDYYTKFDQSHYYSWATLLDPRLSYEGLRRDYADEPELLESLETSKTDLQFHYNISYANSDDSFLPLQHHKNLDHR
ncbi:hypothetical protein B0H10DRAFT_1203841 [Mycena sp. CBHHK59/15]|nr:hypothetical protein B0H10DRAFT_1203841 [Mycena sp. CBHHK59/15]